MFEAGKNFESLGKFGQQSVLQGKATRIASVFQRLEHTIVLSSVEWAKIWKSKNLRVSSL